MKSCAFSFLLVFLVSYGAQAIRLNGVKAKEEGRADTVIVLKTLDAGSTFLDDRVFKKLPHVSRWGQEISEKYKGNSTHPQNWPGMVEWFEHKPGEEIVGGSMEFQVWQESMLRVPGGKVISDWPDDVSKLFTKVKHGKTVLIHLFRHPVEKWVSLFRRDALENVPCNDCRPDNDGPKKGQKLCGKYNMHFPECAAKKIPIDVEKLYQKVAWDDKMNMAIDEAIDRSMNRYPDIFVAKEEYPYQELLTCQGLPQRINRHFGNDVDGCDHSSDYAKTKPRKKLSEVVDNRDDIAARFKGTKWEDIFTEDGNRF